jgi:hypothetical protein
MQQIKYFSRNVTILNILLLTVMIGIIYYYLLPFYHADIRYALPSKKQINSKGGIKPSELVLPSPGDYMIIAEENLFHPERRIPPEKTVEPELPKPEFVLYGTMVSNDLCVAYIEDLKAPRTTPGRGKRQVAIKKGDLLSGFTLKEVDTDKIVMARGEEKMTVHIIDPQKPKQRSTPVSVSQQVTPEPAPRRQQDKPAAATLQKAPVAKKVLPAPKEQAVRPPPQSSFESTVRGFFDRPNQ